MRLRTWVWAIDYANDYVMMIVERRSGEFLALRYDGRCYLFSDLGSDSDREDTDAQKAKLCVEHALRSRAVHNPVWIAVK